jgi:hypothetical protein
MATTIMSVSHAERRSPSGAGRSPSADAGAEGELRLGEAELVKDRPPSAEELAAEIRTQRGDHLLEILLERAAGVDRGAGRGVDRSAGGVEVVAALGVPPPHGPAVRADHHRVHAVGPDEELIHRSRLIR